MNPCLQTKDFNINLPSLLDIECLEEHVDRYHNSPEGFYSPDTSNLFSEKYHYQLKKFSLAIVSSPGKDNSFVALNENFSFYPKAFNASTIVLSKLSSLFYPFLVSKNSKIADESNCI